MNGYLMQEKSLVRGSALFVESFAQENKHGVIFEDDGETGYFYAVEEYPEGKGFSILDALHIYEVGEERKLQAASYKLQGEERGMGGEEEGAGGGERKLQAASDKLQGEETAAGGEGMGGVGGVEESGESNGGERMGAGEGATGEAGVERPVSKLLIVWSRDWEKCALVIDGFCHAVYDFQARGGYNINEFPPPNAIWTRGERKLTDELIRSLF